MARYQFNDDAATPGFSERGTQLSQLVVRVFGFVLMLVGLWIALAVISETWALYRSPAGIERLATAIEQGSHLDQALSRVATPERSTLEDGSSADGNTNTEVLGFRMTYFVAWVIGILLLMLIGRLALAAVKTGGELVLYEAHIKKFARELVREAARGGRIQG